MKLAVAHVATVAAYKIEGGYRGVYKPVDEPRVPSDIFETFEEAKNWARSKAWEMHPGCRFAALRLKNEYHANIWVDV